MNVAIRRALRLSRDSSGRVFANKAAVNCDKRMWVCVWDGRPMAESGSSCDKANSVWVFIAGRRIKWGMRFRECAVLRFGALF
jgi:hypothetical protein